VFSKSYFQARLIQYLTYPIGFAVILFSQQYFNLTHSPMIVFFFIAILIMLFLYSIYYFHEEYKRSKKAQVEFWLKKNWGIYRYSEYIITVINLINIVGLLLFIRITPGKGFLLFEGLIVLPLMVLNSLSKKLNYFSGDIIITDVEIEFSNRFKGMTGEKSFYVSSIEDIEFTRDKLEVTHANGIFSIKYEKLRDEDKDGFIAKFTELMQLKGER